MSDIKIILESVLKSKWFRTGMILFTVSAFFIIVTLLIELPTSIVSIAINLPIIGLLPMYSVLLLTTSTIGAALMVLGTVSIFFNNANTDTGMPDNHKDGSVGEAAIIYDSPMDEDGHCNDDILNNMSDNELLTWLSENPSIVSLIIVKNSLTKGKREVFTASPTQIKNWIRNLTSPESTQTKETSGKQQKVSLAEQIPTWEQLNPAPDIEQALLKGNPTVSTILAKMSRAKTKNPQLEARVFQIAGVRSWTKLSQVTPQKLARIIAHCANEQNYQ